MNYADIKKQCKQDIELLNTQYPFPGLDDTEKLKAWFESTKFMPTTLQSTIAGIKYIILLKYKAKLGFYTPRKIARKKKLHILQAPLNWKDPEVLRLLVKDYSVPEIAKATKRSTNQISYMLFKAGIQYQKPPAPYNPCSSFRWCYYHYIVKNLPLNHCANLANVSYTKFRSWLVNHKIPFKQAVSVNYPNRPWVTVLKHKLSKVSVVEKIVSDRDCVTIRYRNPSIKFYPSVESYYFENIEEKRTVKYKKIISSTSGIYYNMAPIRYEFGNITDINFENAHPAMIMVGRKDIQNLTFIEKRVTLNNYLFKLISRGWMNPTYPIEKLESEWEYLKNYDLSNHTRNGILRSTPTTFKLFKKYKQIPFHFFDMSRLWRIMRKPLRLRSSLNKLFDGIEDVTYTAVLKAMLYESGMKIPVPTLYAAIFKKLGVQSVLDLTPGYGSKAMACAILGIKYIPKKTHTIEYAIDNGFADFIGLDYEWFDENSNTKYDLMVGTDVFSSGLSIVKKYKHRVNNIMAFVRKHAKDELEELYKPTYIVPIVMQINGEIDYIFVW